MGHEEHQAITQIDGVEVAVRPRRRVRSAADVLRLLIAVLLLGVGILVASWGRNTVRGIEADIVAVYERFPDRLGEALTGLAWVLAGALPLLAVIVLVIDRQYRRALALVLGSVAAGAAMVGIDSVLGQRSVVEAVEAELGRRIDLTPSGFATSPLIAAVVAMVVIASSWLPVQWRRALWGGVAVLTLLRVVSSGAAPLDVVIAFAVGLAVGSLALVAFGTPSWDPDGADLVKLLRQVTDPVRIEQVQVGRPLCYVVTLRDGTTSDLCLRTTHDRSADILERLWRYIRLRSSETDRPFSSLRRRVEHEALALTMAQRAGTRVHDVQGVLASGNGDESVGLLLDHIPGTEMGSEMDGVDRALLVDMWQQVARLHRARIAHRQLSLGQVLVNDYHQAVLTGFDSARLAVGDRDLALDTAQLLVDSALRLGPDVALEAAVTALGPEAVTRAVPFLQPLALPAVTRRALHIDHGVLDQLREAIHHRTGVEPAPLERLDRIRPRTALSIVVLTVAFYVLLPQLARVQDTAEAASRANAWWLIPLVGATLATFVFATVAFLAAAAGPVPFWAAVRLQVASSFLTKIAPANTGGLAASVRFLQRVGFEPGAATAAVSLNALSALTIHLTLLVAFVTWTGTSGVGGFSWPDTNTWVFVLAVVVSASGLVGLLPAVRRRVVPPLIHQARGALTSLAGVLTDPLRVLTLLCGSMGITFSYMLAMVAAVEAFGGGLSFPQIGAAYLVASALGSVAPTPGGLGALEAALVAGLTGYGMPDSRAVPAVLTFRLLTYWIPVIPGWFTFNQMQRHQEL